MSFAIKHKCVKVLNNLLRGDIETVAWYAKESVGRIRSNDPKDLLDAVCEAGLEPTEFLANICNMCNLNSTAAELRSINTSKPAQRPSYPATIVDIKVEQSPDCNTLQREMVEAKREMVEAKREMVEAKREMVEAKRERDSMAARALDSERKMLVMETKMAAMENALLTMRHSVAELASAKPTAQPRQRHSIPSVEVVLPDVPESLKTKKAIKDALLDMTDRQFERVRYFLMDSCIEKAGYGRLKKSMSEKSRLEVTDALVSMNTAPRAYDALRVAVSNAFP
ncbi:hypothetical protein [Epizootic haematopoietic necrosis virus]|uniref:Uncharacterized protein n=1 Tax=Epizootic haematopoietic necrosis virus TaxID=100217 RepID=A0A7G9TLI0_9VIRU|nr:hypothetical protein [Epizootic haematopoietic necrosis virus]